MEANMNPNSIVPLYVQVVECLKRDIENGVYNATGRIPTEAELAEQYKVSRITIRRAVRSEVRDWSRKNRERELLSAARNLRKILKTFRVSQRCVII